MIPHIVDLSFDANYVILNLQDRFCHSMSKLFKLYSVVNSKIYVELISKTLPVFQIQAFACNLRFSKTKMLCSMQFNISDQLKNCIIKFEWHKSITIL